MKEDVRTILHACSHRKSAYSRRTDAGKGLWYVDGNAREGARVYWEYNTSESAGGLKGTNCGHFLMEER